MGSLGKGACCRSIKSRALIPEPTKQAWLAPPVITTPPPTLSVVEAGELLELMRCQINWKNMQTLSQTYTYVHTERKNRGWEDRIYYNWFMQKLFLNGVSFSIFLLSFIFICFTSWHHMDNSIKIVWFRLLHEWSTFSRVVIFCYLSRPLIRRK